jgi:hypothetical protein
MAVSSSLRMGLRRCGPWALTTVVALGAAGLLLLWVAPMLAMGLEINPVALMPPIDPVGQAASDAHPPPQACEEAPGTPAARRSDASVGGK